MTRYVPEYRKQPCHVIHTECSNPKCRELRHFYHRRDIPRVCGRFMGRNRELEQDIHCEGHLVPLEHHFVAGVCDLNASGRTRAFLHEIDRHDWLPELLPPDGQEPMLA